MVGKGLLVFSKGLYKALDKVNFFWHLFTCMGGAVASWLVRSSLERVVWVRALAGDTVLCSRARHLTLIVPLSTQEYKWVPANCWGNLSNCRGMTCDGHSILSRGSRNTPSRFML